MDLDLLYVLLALGAASPYAAQAAYAWAQRSDCGKSFASLVQSHLPQ
jgi:hypothetical protein